jgi:hypothetical protein
VLLESRAINENVVEIRRTEDIQKESQRVVDEMLKCRRSVREFERDYESFEQLLSCSKDGFPFVLFCHSQKIIDVSNIQSRIISSGAQLVQSLLNQRKRVSILDDFPVELSIVDTKTKRFILLLDEQNRCFRS